MQIGKTKEDVFEVLADAIHKYKKNKRRFPIIDKIADELVQYEVNTRYIREIFDNPEEELPKQDQRLVCLFMESFSQLSGIKGIDPTIYYTPDEIKSCRLYSGAIEREEVLTLPYTFQNATQLTHNTYLVQISCKEITQLSDGQVLHYNLETQREPRHVKRIEGIRKIPRVYYQNIAEMTELLLEDKLVPSTLVFNAAVGTSDEGTELNYNPRERTLTVNKGTILDNLDGYHRQKAAMRALTVNPDLEFVFPLIIGNYTVSEARHYVGQLGKATPISESRVQELIAEKHSAEIIRQLELDSDLKNRISRTEENIHNTSYLVYYSTLADAIDNNFSPKSKLEATKISKNLVEFFNYLIGSFPEEFIINVNETRERSYINRDFMFAGYVKLAKRMFDENIELDNIEKIIKSIDFNKNTSPFKEGTLYKKAPKRVIEHTEDYFAELDLRKIIEEME
ncbi:DNA sulfur modification protein DndB [Priestia endophytica]